MTDCNYGAQRHNDPQQAVFTVELESPKSCGCIDDGESQFLCIECVRHRFAAVTVRCTKCGATGLPAWGNVARIVRMP